MIGYVTRPDNHEVIMGGMRDVLFWTDKPHFYHWPVRGWMPMPSEDPKAVYSDRGWEARERTSRCRFKPLAVQNPELLTNSWRLILWSCIPKSAQIALEDTFTWCDTLLPGEDKNDEFHKTNGCMLLWHYNRDTDIQSTIHFKRFLMEVNLISGECRLVIPSVHFFDGSRTENTQEISEPYASRTNYTCPEMDEDIPF